MPVCVDNEKHRLAYILEVETELQVAPYRELATPTDEMPQNPSKQKEQENKMTMRSGCRVDVFCLHEILGKNEIVKLRRFIRSQFSDFVVYASVSVRIVEGIVKASVSYVKADAAIDTLPLVLKNGKWLAE